MKTNENTFDFRLKNYFVVTASAVLGLLYWPIDALINAFYFNQGTFFHQFFNPEASDALMRTVILIPFFIFGAGVQYLSNRQRELILRLNEQKSMTRLIIDSAHEAFLTINERDEITDWNPFAESLFGWKKKEILGKTLSETILPQTFRIHHIEELKPKSLSHENFVSEKTVEHIAKHRDGHIIHVQIVTSKIKHNNIVLYTAFIRDITSIKHTEAHLKRLSFYDELTGLPNRRMLDERLNKSINQAQRNSGIFGLLFIDLDGFKKVNDTLGHKTGDQLLEWVSQRISKTIRSYDVVARVGGDEFIVLLMDIKNYVDTQLVAEKIIAKLNQPCNFLTNETRIGASIGISIYPADGQKAETLIKKADTAMYQAKKLGRNQYCLAYADAPKNQLRSQ